MVVKREQIFEKTESGGLKLITIDENTSKGLAPKFCLAILESRWFNMAMLLLVLANAIFTVTIRHTHREAEDRQMLRF